MNRATNLFTLILVLAVAGVSFFLFISMLKDNKRDISEVGVGGGGGGGVGQSTDDTLSLGGSTSTEVVSGTGAEKNREEGRAEDQKKIANSENIQAFKGKGNKYVQSLQSASELHQKFPQKGETLPKAFEEKIANIDGVSRTNGGNFVYTDPRSRGKIATSLKKQDFDVGIDGSGTIIGRTKKYEVRIGHAP